MASSRNAETDRERDAATLLGARRNIFTSVLAGVLVLFGAVLLFGGIWLALIGGSLYYVLIGGAIVVAGALIFRRNRLGAWLYAAIFALTIPWALWETGPDPWALVPRLIAHAVLLALVALATPLLIRRTSWPLALGGAAGAIAVLAVVLFGAAISAPDAVRGSYPDKSLAGLEQATGSDWPAWGGTHESLRFSRLDQITPDNVGGLQRAWVAHTGDLPAGVRWHRKVRARNDSAEDWQSPLSVFGDEHSHRARCEYGAGTMALRSQGFDTLDPVLGYLSRCCRLS